MNLDDFVKETKGKRGRQGKNCRRKAKGAERGFTGEGQK